MASGNKVVAFASSNQSKFSLKDQKCACQNQTLTTVTIINAHEPAVKHCIFTIAEGETNLLLALLSSLIS